MNDLQTGSFGCIQIREKQRKLPRYDAVIRMMIKYRMMLIAGNRCDEEVICPAVSISGDGDHRHQNLRIRWSIRDEV